MDLSIAELESPAAPAFLARLRAAAPVAWLEALGGWLITGYYPAVEVMRDAGSFTVDDARFSTARVVGASMLSLDGAAHQRQRAAFAAPFRPGRVEERFGTEVSDLAAELVARIRPQGRADLRATLAGPLSVAVITSALGLGGVSPETVLGWYAAIVDAVSTISAGGEPGPAAAAAVEQLSAHLRADPGAGAGSVLANAAQSLTAAEVVSNAAVVLFGGIETTESMIANLMVHVLSHDGVLAALGADPSLIAAALEESLRLEPAAAFVDRYATRSVHLGGHLLRGGDLVRVSLTAANRDPAVFADPDVFELRRPNARAQLSFARGPHVCVAMDLARLEARQAIGALVHGLPGVHLDGPAPPRGLVFRKPAAVPAIWDPGP
ncbi:MAG: cytochrome P450 [Acidimicrobiales bacterium]